MRHDNKPASRHVRATGPGGAAAPPGGEHLLIRADLLNQVQRAIASRRLKQTEAAALFGVSQPRVSDLMRGRIDLFSTDVLIDMLARLGVQIRFVRRSGQRQ